MVLLEQLLAAGARGSRAHDPKAVHAVQAHFGDACPAGIARSTPMRLLEGSDALVLVTEWRQYWAPDFARLADLMRQPVIMDGRNIWSPDVVRARGFTYYSIGRP